MLRLSEACRALGVPPAPEGPTSAISSPGTTMPEVGCRICLLSMVCLSNTCSTAPLESPSVSQQCDSAYTPASCHDQYHELEEISEQTRFLVHTLQARPLHAKSTGNWTPSSSSAGGSAPSLAFHLWRCLQPPCACKRDVINVNMEPCCSVQIHRGFAYAVLSMQRPVNA